MPMTLEEAIKHLNEILADKTWPCEYSRAEHEQLRDWLLELRHYKRKSEPVITYQPFIDLKGSNTDIMIMSVPPTLWEVKDVNATKEIYADYRSHLTRNKRLSQGLMNPVEAIGAFMLYVYRRIDNENRNFVVITDTEAVLIRNVQYNVNTTQYQTKCRFTCVNLKTGEEALSSTVIDYSTFMVFERKDLVTHEQEWCADKETLNKVEALRITFDIEVGNSNVKGVMCTNEPECLGIQSSVTSEFIERLTLGMIYLVADKLGAKEDIHVNCATMGVKRNNHPKYHHYSIEACWDNVLCKNTPPYNRSATINVKDSYIYEVEPLQFKETVREYIADNLVTITATTQEGSNDSKPDNPAVGVSET